MIYVGWEAELLDIVVPGNEKSGKEKNGQIQLAEMTSSTSCRIGKLELTAEDLLFNDRLLSKVAISVAGQCPAGGALQDQSKYLPALQTGDMVAVYRVSDTQYLVLGKMVSV